MLRCQWVIVQEFFLLVCILDVRNNVWVPDEEACIWILRPEGSMQYLMMSNRAIRDPIVFLLQIFWQVTGLWDPTISEFYEKL